MPGNKSDKPDKESKSDKGSHASKLVELEATIDSLTSKVNKNSKDVKASIETLRGNVNKNITDIAANLRLIKKEKLEREMEGLKRKFVIRGYEWEKATFT
jgi:formiminotetrahydrofolate cyclodeaminase